ncbi:hypothetical protein MMMDOFMJ_4620 [Methylobacterium gnaphalii]|nr:hypothetical protein MMMDOFMJ_4620 [Methylobacterium gnaphalii]
MRAMSGFGGLLIADAELKRQPYQWLLLRNERTGSNDDLGSRAAIATGDKR